MKSNFFRADIQCLRGLSVLAVVLFHLRENLFPGGYLGVDVFFVISGYVITGSIVRELELTGKFSLKHFYRRRLIRLYPALIGTVALTLIAVHFLIPIYDAEKIIKTGLLATIGFANNYLFRTSQDYFGLGTQLNPFLHTWSLGIEEQFYVVCSFFIWLLARLKKASLISAISTVGIVSFIYFAHHILYSGSYSAAFYLLPARAWQLCLGAFGALVLTKSSNVQKGLGIVGLIFVFVFADGYLIAKYPELEIASRGVASICALILCFPGRNDSDLIPRSNIAKMVQKIFLFLGDKSYSIYLIHWPLIAIGLWLDSSLVYSILLPFLILSLSWLSWRAFEKGFKGFGKLKMPAILMAAALVPVALKLSGISTEQNQKWTEVHKDVIAEVGMTPCGDDIRKLWPDAFCKMQGADKPYLYLIGDSHAVHLLWGAEIYARANGFNLALLRTRFSYASVKPHVDRQTRLKTWVKDRKYGVKPPEDRLNAFAAMVGPTDKLILSSYTSRYVERVEQSVIFPTESHTNKILNQNEVRQKIDAEFLSFLQVIPQTTGVFLVLDTPILNAYPGTCLQDESKCDVSLSDVAKQRKLSSTILNNFTQNFSNVRALDLNPFLCDANLCKLRNSAGELLYRDDNHLSPLGGRIFAQALDSLNKTRTK